MNYEDVIAHYDAQVNELTTAYETLAFESVHADLLPHLPPLPSSVLDIGAGSGRDAAWLAKNGFEVVAVEPSSQMLARSKTIHSDDQIIWLQDRLPDLKQTLALGTSFHVILLSAVWMHIAPTDRARAFRKLSTLLKPGGIIALSLRHGQHHLADSVYPVSVLEVEKLAVQHGLSVALVSKSPDQLERSSVHWETVILKLPDDGTGALPLLRNVIINDSKSSTYKLALLRTLLRIADGANGLAAISDDETVRVPLGLVALYWLRLYKPLVENSVPQMPPLQDNRQLSFVKASFHQLSSVSPFELKVGAIFHGPLAMALNSALKDAAQTIRKMPAFYITYPNSAERVFKVGGRMKSVSQPDRLTITTEYLWSFGELQIPLNIWNTFSRYASWIEPSIVWAWINLMQNYSDSAGTKINLDRLVELLKWLDPDRDTALVRSVISKMAAAGSNIHCVWSGKELRLDRVDIDHCFPFSAWPCNDLWNLLPADREVNNRKSDKLVRITTLDAARDRIENFWNDAYFDSHQSPFVDRFKREALASLPLLCEQTECSFFENVFEAMYLKRSGLKQNQNLEEWDF